MKKTIFIAFLMLLPMLASADNVDINGIWYNLNAETRTAEVTSQSSNSTTVYNSKYVTIPSQVNYNEVSYQVTSIGENAFTNRTNLEYIGIPSSVTSIGNNAFMGCSGLDMVNIEDITAWCNIQFANASANPLHSGRFLYINGVEVTQVTFPDTMTSIQPWVFTGCINLTSVTIPTSVTKIGQGAFFNSGLTSVEIPSSVTTIGESAFQRCGKMVSVNIPNTLTNIEPKTFSECSSLTSISIPSSVKSIGSDAFGGCYKLEAVHIKDLSVWCKTQFRSFYSNPLGYAHHLYVDGKEVKDLVIPTDVSEISDYAFYECDGLTSVTFPSHVTNIGTYSFQQCNGLTDIVIPSNVTEIQNCAFMSCENLKTVAIEEGVKTIGGAAFFQCSALNSIVIPNSVTTLGESSFCRCTAMNSATIGNSIKEIPSFAFGYCTALKELYCYAEDVPTVDKDGFAQTDIQNITLFVPIAAINAYQAVEPWKNFKAIVGMTVLDDYRPLVEEGKHWTYDNYMPERPAKYNHYYYYDLKGDTLIAGKNSLKMFSDNSNNDGIVRYVGALYEENKKVYCFYPEQDEAVLLYDFDCEVGDTIHVNAGKMVVKDIQTEDNGGIPIKKYTFQNNVIWIEGVGAMKDFFSMVPLMGNYNSLNACELNGEKLYQTVAPVMTMITEGKRWNYIHYYIDEEGEHRDPYSYVVKGDTIINRTFYKKLWYQDEKTEKLVCILFEAGHEIFKKYDNSYMTSFFDFGREDFGRVFTWKAKNASGNTNWMVYGVDTIEVNNRPFRRYTCLQKYSKEGEKLTTIEYDGKGVWHDIWVEGIGSASSGIEDQNPLHEPPVKTTSDYTYFVSCYENGECIFTTDDFNIQPTPKPDINMAYYYYYEGNKIPLTLNENKVVVSIPKDCGEITERFRANVQTQASIRDDIYDIYVITRTEYEKLTLLDFWAEDAKSIILTSSYFTESNEEVFATPYLNVRLKKEEDIDLLTSYAEQYKLTIVRNSPLMPLWYILAVTLESEKSPLECANELYESGNFVSSVPDLVDVIIPETAYRTFVEEGKVWAVKVISDWWPTEEWFEYYYFDGDTFVNGQKAKRMLFDRIGTSQDTYGEYVGAWFEQDKKVYYAANGKQQFELIYDFTLSTGDNIQSLEGILQVTKMSGCIPGFKGTYYDLQYSYDTNIVERWLEGVGSESYPWLNLRGEWAGNRGDLLFCIVGDEIIYYNSEEGDPYIMGAKKRFDFTHTIKIDPKAPMKREAEQSLYGEYNNQQLGINLNSLEDAYLVRITDKTGKVVYEKDINAGNIVGLNINISTYGDGRYTVTMENNHESFTGEFEVQTSGIEEVRNNHEMIKGYIYNLQGQRISTLQKGLNIVNGRKVYVK